MGWVIKEAWPKTLDILYMESRLRNSSDCYDLHEQNVYWDCTEIVLKTVSPFSRRFLDSSAALNRKLWGKGLGCDSFSLAEWACPMEIKQTWKRRVRYIYIFAVLRFSSETEPIHVPRQLVAAQSTVGLNAPNQSNRVCLVHIPGRCSAPWQLTQGELFLQMWQAGLGTGQKYFNGV